MGEVYQMDIAGCKRELPICPLNGIWTLPDL